MSWLRLVEHICMYGILHLGSRVCAHGGDDKCTGMSSSYFKTLRHVITEKLGVHDRDKARSSEFPLRQCPGCGVYSRAGPDKCPRCTDEKFLLGSDCVVRDLNEDNMKNREQLLYLWNEVISECQKNNKPFVDDAFPANAASVFYDAAAESASADIRWDRPSNRRPAASSNSTDSACRDVFSKGYWPGRRSWLADALELVSERLDVLLSCILTEEVCPEGAYVLRLCKDGVWLPIVVDDFLPFVPSSGKPLMALIEKAAAKLCGTYEALTVDGDVCDGLEMLTGAATESTSLVRAALDIDHVWTNLVDDYDNEFLITATSRELSMTNEKTRPIGLQSCRNYVVLKVFQDDHLRCLELHLPSAYLGVERDDQDAGFCMKYEDFLEYFDALHVCRVRPDWTEVRIEGKLPSKCSTDEPDIDVPIRRLNVAERTLLDLTIYQNSQREKSSKDRRCLTDLSIVIFKERNGHDIHNRVNFADVICYSPRSTQGSVSLQCQLDLGAYLIACLSVNSLVDENLVDGDDVKFVMAVRSPQPLLPMRRLQFTKCALTDALIRLTMFKGAPALPTILSPGINAFAFRKDWHGLIMVIENTVCDKFAVVNFTCRLNDSVMATRPASFTKDYVPSRTRRLVAFVSAKKWDRLDDFSIGCFVTANVIDRKDPSDDESTPKFNDRVKGLHVPRPIWLT